MRVGHGWIAQRRKRKHARLRLAVKRPFSPPGKIAAPVCACSLGMMQTASAQFVPRHVTVIAGPGSNFGGADTARSEELRGMGQFYQGQRRSGLGAPHANQQSAICSFDRRNRSRLPPDSSGSARSRREPSRCGPGRGPITHERNSLQLQR